MSENAIKPSKTGRILAFLNDYAKQEKWKDYAKNNDCSIFMLLFERDFSTMAVER